MHRLLNFIRKHKILTIVIGVGFIFQMSVMMPSGSYYCFENGCGFAFWGVHSFDALWHLEIAGSSFVTSPARVPTFAGATLSGYNILMDWFIFALSEIGISPLFTLFKIIPLFWFIAYTASILFFAKAYRPKHSFFAVVLLGVLYFAGHLGYLLQLYHHGSILKGAQSFSLQSLTTLLNTQFALTLPFLMLMFGLLARRQFSWKTTIMFALSTAIIIGLKFYGGVIAVFLCAFYLLDHFLIQRRIVTTVFQGLIIGICVIASVYVVYDPLRASSSGSIFVFSPFAIVHSVIEEIDMVYLPDLVNARYFLYAQGHWGPRLVAIELLSALLYFIINFGMRVAGMIFVLWKMLRNKSSRLEIYIFLTILFSFTLSVSLIQKGDWWNTVQFSYYGIVFAGILFADLLFHLINSGKKWKTGLAVFLVILSLPSNISVINTFWFSMPPYIPQEEMQALKVLKEQSDGIVFTSFDQKKNMRHPLSSYENTGYVAAFTGKQLYLGHLGPLTIIGVDYKPRLERVRKKDCSVFREVDYIYLTKWQDGKLLTMCKKEMKRFGKIYDSKSVVIWKGKRTIYCASRVPHHWSEAQGMGVNARARRRYLIAYMDANAFQWTQCL